MKTPLGISAGRQKILQVLEEQTKLTPVDEPDGINNIIDAVNDIAVERVLSSGFGCVTRWPSMSSVVNC